MRMLKVPQTMNSEPDVKRGRVSRTDLRVKHRESELCRYGREHAVVY